MAFTLPKLSLPKLAPPSLALNKKQLPAIVGGVIVLAAAGWFGWQYFAGEPAPPPAPVKPVARPAAPSKAATPADTAQARDKLIDEVLVATGLKQHLNQLPERLLTGVRQSAKQHTKASPATLKAIEDAIAKSFTAERFQGQVSTDLKKNFDQKRMQALLKDFSTPAAKSMVELERAAPSPEALAQFARSAAATKPSPPRAALIKRIDAATRASDLAVDSAFVSMKALSLGIVGADTPKAAAIDKAIEKQRAVATQNIRDATLLNLAFSFKDASNADLEKYAGIYETENSKWLHGLMYASLLEAVKSASAEAGTRIGELAGEPTAKPARSKSGADARTCLGLGTNAAVIKCAEQYR